MALRFHWMLVKGGEGTGGAGGAALWGTRAAMSELVVSGLPDLDRRIEFCRRAEDCGIDSLLMSFGWYEPDPMLLAAALGRETRRLRFIVAYRSGLLAPASFVQQVNTLSALIGGRVSLNVVAGTTEREQRSYGDFLDHDARYRRTDEFLAVCRALWDAGGEGEPGVDFEGRHYRVEGGRLGTPFVAPDGARSPEIYVGGHSDEARRLAAARADCWLRMADAPEALGPAVAEMRASGTGVGLRLGVIARPSRAEARAVAERLVADRRLERLEREFVGRSDSTSVRASLDAADRAEWLTDTLWTGAVPFYGAPSIALVGGYDEVAGAFAALGRLGVGQFILHGWPKREEMLRFGGEIVPRVRELEAAAADGDGAGHAVPRAAAPSG
jgi:alkanesulfonate monooxygenase